MKTLHAFIEKHTVVDKERETPCADLVFFKVSTTGEPDPSKLRQLLALSAGEGAFPVDALDGKEHSYIELGAWLDSQGLALRLMGLGQLLGLWQLLTPKNMLGSLATEELTQQLAGAGYISIVSRPAASASPAAA